MKPFTRNLLIAGSTVGAAALVLVVTLVVLFSKKKSSSSCASADLASLSLKISAPTANLSFKQLRNRAVSRALAITDFMNLIINYGSFL